MTSLMTFVQLAGGWCLAACGMGLMLLLALRVWLAVVDRFLWYAKAHVWVVRYIINRKAFHEWYAAGNGRRVHEEIAPKRL